MKVFLNLASRPFGRNRPFYVTAGVAGFVLAAAALVMVATFVRSYRRSPELVRQSDHYRRRLSELARKQIELETVMRR
ncbi:MAG: hypothetical protein HY238_08845, partial [Acidobacteria bacterium]|nr:hypothetical protein [Acidobacteriota bacterium]